MEQPPLEIERKFLIRMPDIATLTAQPGCRVLELVQTYLAAPQGVTARVRQCREGARLTWWRTEKRRLSDKTAIENEAEIEETTYRAALATADPTRRPIEKRRYAIPYAGHILEIDVYPFWEDCAILEVELQSEDEAFALPPYLTLIREVTADRRYKNAQLAKHIPPDPWKEDI